MPSTRVVVTGLGATTPLGGDVASTWEAHARRPSGVRRLTEDWVEQLPVQIAAAVAVEPPRCSTGSRPAGSTASSQFALIAAREAWADAGPGGLRGRPRAARRRARLRHRRRHHAARQGRHPAEKGARRVSPLTVPMLMPNGPAADVGLELGARRGVHTPVSRLRLRRRGDRATAST